MKMTKSFGRGSRSESDSPYADMDESDLRDEIETAKERFFELNIEDSKTEMYQLAEDLVEMNQELADRKGSDPTADQYEEKAERWSDVADLVLDGTDPTESIPQGSGASDESIDADVEQFRLGTPEKTFQDVGGYNAVKNQLCEEGIKLIEHREFLQGTLNLSVLNGVILGGPPGTGKTLMSRAFAGEFDARIDEDVTVYKVKPNQLKRGVRGESGKLLRGLFTAAKQNQPAVIIFEEIDTLVQSRSDTSVQRMQSDRDLVNSFLDEVNEIDTEDVICMGTTNRMGDLDEAAIRDKRLQPIEMGLPGPLTRQKIFKIHIHSIPERFISDDIKMQELGETSQNMSGAAIASAVEDAVLTMGLEYKQGERENALLRHDDLITAIKDRTDRT